MVVVAAEVTHHLLQDYLHFQLDRTFKFSLSRPLQNLLHFLGELLHEIELSIDFDVVDLEKGGDCACQ